MRSRTSVLVLSSCLSVLALVAGLLVPAAAEDTRARKKEADRRAASAKAALAESSREVSDAASHLDRAQTRLAGARAGLERAEAKVQRAEKRDAHAAEKLAAAEREEEAAEGRVAGVRDDIDATRKRMGVVARESYQQQGPLGQVSFVLDADDVRDLQTRVNGVQRLLRAEEQEVEDFHEARARLQVEQERVEAVRVEVADLRREAAAALDRTEEAEERAQAARNRVSRLVGERRSALRAAERVRARDARRYERMKAESRRLQQVLAARARTASFSGTGALQTPVAGPVTSSYGMRQHPITGEYKLHDGTDFGAGCGTPVRAAAAGRVVRAAALTGYGNQVALDHGRARGVGLATSYSHLTSFAVGAGQRVSAGQVIGHVGSTGYSTGCHLHFMVYENGATTNPAGWL
jgi:murein DD-endopeptidase MepM/ murein hydrolase activator NlpD